MGNCCCIPKPFSFEMQGAFHDPRLRILTEKDAQAALEVMVHSQSGDEHIAGNGAWSWIYQESSEEPQSEDRLNSFRWAMSCVLWSGLRYGVVVGIDCPNAPPAYRGLGGLFILYPPETDPVYLGHCAKRKLYPVMKHINKYHANDMTITQKHRYSKMISEFKTQRVCVDEELGKDKYCYLQCVCVPPRMRGKGIRDVLMGAVDDVSGMLPVYLECSRREVKYLISKGFSEGVHMIIDTGSVTKHTKNDLELVGMVWTPAPVNLIVTKCSSMFPMAGEEIDYEENDEERHPEHEDDTPDSKQEYYGGRRKTPNFLTAPAY